MAPTPDSIRHRSSESRRFPAGILRTATAALLCTAGCQPGPAEAPLPAVEMIQSPAGPGSGQPSLERLEDAVLLAWTEPAAEGEHALKIARLGASGWEPPLTVVQRDSLFVNWADFSLVRDVGGGTLAAHWLVRFPKGGAAYRVEAAFSEDGGETWSAPWSPHEDGTETEHGFVSWMTTPDGGAGLTWLDGRGYANREGGEAGHGGGGGEMSLRYRARDPDGTLSPEVVLDSRTCDCCQTTAAQTTTGPIVAYRGRSQDEIRDIEIVRWGPDGWSEPAVVHADGWRIEGCPVNGPALAAREDDVAIVWFTAADQTPRVNVAFSADGGVTFGAPVVVDDGHPEGRVDIEMGRDGSVWISWLERTGSGADVRVRRIEREGQVHPSVTVAASSEGRASGFPRMAAHPSGGLVLAWTDPSEPSTVRVARIDTESP